MRFCRIVVFALATVVLAGAATTVDAQTKIGVVDLQRAINETEDGRQAKRRLKKVFDDRQKILEKMQTILRRIGQTDGYTMIIEANEGGVVWVPSNLDLTDVLIQKYNQQAKSGGGAKQGGGAKKPK